ncbi:hypothetical protein ACQ859_00805 [Roseateles chitinivorans]|uniref:hypothetical protein n=1 Tax=Roseateles chitinivorans TaxID=2917965 RepID=UPI003D669AE0
MAPKSNWIQALSSKALAQRVFRSPSSVFCAVSPLFSSALEVALMPVMALPGWLMSRPVGDCSDGGSEGVGVPPPEGRLGGAGAGGGSSGSSVPTGDDAGGEAGGEAAGGEPAGARRPPAGSPHRWRNRRRRRSRPACRRR